MSNLFKRFGGGDKHPTPEQKRDYEAHGINQRAAESVQAKEQADTRRLHENRMAALMSDPSELIQGLPPQFYKEDFDAVGYFIDTLPQFVSQQELVKELEQYKKKLAVVSSRLSKRVKENHTEFVRGMQHIQDIGMDLTLTKNLCHTTRRMLGKTDRDVITSGLDIVTHRRRRQRILASCHLVIKIRTLFRDEVKMRELLKERKFCEAIALHEDICKRLNSLNKLDCLQSMRRRFGDGPGAIKEKLEERVLEFRGQALDIDNDEFEKIVKAYIMLEDVDALETLIKRSFLFAVDHFFRQAVVPYVLQEGDDPSNLERMKFRDLCSRIDVDNFLACFLDVLGDLAELLCSYFKLTQKVVQLIIEANSEEEKRGHGSENGRIRRASSVEADASNRRALWSCVQDRLGSLLSGITISAKTKMKMEDLLQVLDYSHQFMDLGQRFCGSDSKKLRESVVKKCKQYVADFQRATFEAFAVTLENEMWQQLPVSKDFGLHSIKEFVEPPSSDTKPNTDPSAVSPRYNGVPDSNSYTDPFAKYLTRENVFRAASERHRKQGLGEEKDEYSSASDDEDESNYLSIGRASRSIGVYKRVPLVTSVSLNMIRKIGKLVQMMETLKPVSSEAFASIRDLFDYYLYQVFMMFGIGQSKFFPQKPESVQQKPNVFGKSQGPEQPPPKPPYPVLLKAVNSTRSRLGSQHFGGVAFRTGIGSHASVQLNSNIFLKNPDRLNGIMERTIATESLVFVVDIFRKIEKRLQASLPIHEKLSVSEFVRYSQQVVEDFRMYIYRNVATFLVEFQMPMKHSGINGSSDVLHSGTNSRFRRPLKSRKPSVTVQPSLKQVAESIGGVDWSPNSICDTHHEYVDILLRQFSEFLEKIKDMGDLPDFVMQRLHRETIIFILEMVTQAYAKVVKCSAEGRASMSFDQNSLRTGLQELTRQESELVEVDPMPKWDHVNNYIHAFYLQQDDLMDWVENHATEYTMEQHLSVARCGLAGVKLKRRAAKEFEVDIEHAFARGIGKTKK